MRILRIFPTSSSDSCSGLPVVLVIRLEQPDLDTRRDVVIAKGRQQGQCCLMRSPPLSLTILPTIFAKSKVRYIKVITYAKSFRRAIDLELSRQALSDVLARDASEPRQKVVLQCDR